MDVKESRIFSKVVETFNSTFLAMVPKNYIPESFKDLMLISLCNVMHRIISKFIARRLKHVLFPTISGKQFGFLDGKQIHKVIDIAKEGLHSIKVKKKSSFIIKLDLFKGSLVNLLIGKRDVTLPLLSLID